MALSGKAVNKLIFVGLYGGLIALVVWGGSRLINYSLDSRFYKDFLLQWEASLSSYSVKSGIWPHFSGSNHVEYMDNLNQLMSRSSVSLPKSNTGHLQELTVLLMENLAKIKVFLQAVLARMARHTLVCGDYEIRYGKRRITIP
jgi:hypothetical protein